MPKNSKQANDENTIEHYVETYGSVYSIVHIIIAIAAIYYSIRCNKGPSVCSLLAAVFFPWFYLIYIYFYHYNECFVNNQ
jgi:hypothetical protein